MKDAYTLDEVKARQIVKKSGIKMYALSAACGKTDTWLSHAIRNGRMPRKAFDRLAEIGVDLTKAVIRSPNDRYINTDFAKIVRIVNLRAKGYPYWLITSAEQISETKVRQYLYTWRYTRFGLAKEEIEELIRIWDKEDEAAFIESTDGQG